MLETYLNKNWYCLEFDLTHSDLGFTTRFWIFITELFVTMNSWRKWKSMDLSVDLWHSNNMKVILPNYLILFSNFQKTWLNLQLCVRNPIKSVLSICPSVHLSICLSVCLSVCDAFFSVSALDFLTFLYEDNAVYTKKWPSGNLFVV